MLNETPLSSTQRNNLDDKQFGIPEIRAYPLNDKSHVIQAVRMFNHVDSKYEKELADNLIKAIKKFKIDVTVGEDNRFHKYYIRESRNMKKTVEAILEGLNDSRERIPVGEALDNYLTLNLKGFKKNQISYDGKYWSFSLASNYIRASEFYKNRMPFSLNGITDLGEYGDAKDTFKNYKDSCIEYLNNADKELSFLLKVLGDAKKYLKKEGYSDEEINLY